VKRVLAIEDTLDPRPNFLLLGCSIAAVGLVSFSCLAWPQALSSSLLGGLMIVGADIDARFFLLPDLVTLGGLLSGILVSAALAPSDPWLALTASAGQAFALFALLEGVRRACLWLRDEEGLGFGDVKLAGAIGAWLPFESIPLCFTLAAGAGLATVTIGHLRGVRIERKMQLPFGLFLCPSLWLVYYTGLL
jgi:leader peptidase (prepilin peptidase)/N-methyltransferase